ncbi:hypothetical protein [Salipiger bermudensis]|uniref:hypothetical protein n=1 Tax=Salipiger bermudensis TaxID=344736 RepID=UPI001CD60DED|nr:hypothetical protein [Salipiger bermudensis]MCA0961792.1 hypothetical protein [Salipiger bermudensis]
MTETGAAQKTSNAGTENGTASSYRAAKADDLARSDRSAAVRAETASPASGAASNTASKAPAAETAPEEDIAAARAEAIAAQESFKKSLLVASMSAGTGETAAALSTPPRQGAASYAAARSPAPDAAGSRSIAA